MIFSIGVRRVACCFVAFMLCGLLVGAQAEVIAVEQVEKGFFVSSTPTLTMYWLGQNSKAVLVFIPGERADGCCLAGQSGRVVT
jgi:hypothetical protein